MPGASGRLRVLVAAAGAITLHAALLLSSRPTLLGSAASPTVPAMLVRMLAPANAVPLPADAAVAAVSALALPAAPLATARARAAMAPAAERAPALLGATTAADTVPVAAPPSPAVAPGLPPAPAYLMASRLDPGPHPIDEVDPAYPENANLQEGSVVLRLLISEAGAVDNVAVVRAYPAGLFDQSALEAFGRARFSPGMRFGIPVKSQITVEVMFTPINRGARVSGRSY
ncbi:MAG: energy transducer TonB [Burkholderiaceae bacterium]